MPYDKKTWQNGENKYDIQKQDGTVLQQDIKLVYKGSTGTPVSAANMNAHEDAIALAVSTAEQAAAIANVLNDALIKIRCGGIPTI